MGGWRGSRQLGTGSTAPSGVNFDVVYNEASPQTNERIGEPCRTGILPVFRLDSKAGKQQCAFMRTTLDLPDEIFQRAKIAAVEQGTTLRELVGQALAHKLGLAAVGAHTRKRMRFPIFASASPGKLNLTNAALSKIEGEEDARHHGLAG